MENTLGQVELLNKIYVKGKSEKPVIRVIMIIGIVIAVIMFLISLIGEGFSFGLLIRSLVIPVGFFTSVLSATSGKEGYKSVPLIINYDSEGIRLIYESIDREDKMGRRMEEIYIRFDNITKIEYSNPLKCFNIQGYPLEKIKYLEKNSKKEAIYDYSQKREEKRNYIYVSDENRMKIGRILKSHTDISIEELD